MAHTTIGPSRHSFGTVSIHILPDPTLPPNLPFFPIVQHTGMKIPNYPRKGSFLFSTAAHIALLLHSMHTDLYAGPTNIFGL